jgi:hypothetical protein
MGMDVFLDNLHVPWRQRLAVFAQHVGQAVRLERQQCADCQLLELAGS